MIDLVIEQRRRSLGGGLEVGNQERRAGSLLNGRHQPNAVVDSLWGAGHSIGNDGRLLDQPRAQP